MARIAGIDIPREKQIEVSLTYLYGIGRKSACKILSELSINPSVKTKDLSDDEINSIRKYIDKSFTIEGDLRRLVNANIKRLMDLGCYRGLRHRKSLPVRGQRTKTNSRARKGPKKTVANKKK